jgi:hypothetical protein
MMAPDVSYQLAAMSLAHCSDWFLSSSSACFLAASCPAENLAALSALNREAEIDSSVGYSLMLQYPCSLSNKQTNKLHALSAQANYTDRATAACRRSDCQLLRIKGATWLA